MYIAFLDGQNSRKIRISTLTLYVNVLDIFSALGKFYDCDLFDRSNC